MSQHTLGADPPVSASGLGYLTRTDRRTGQATSATVRIRPFPRVRS